MKKIYNSISGPVGHVLGIIITSARGSVVTDIDSADEILCDNINEALDLLLSGKKVILFAVGFGSGNSVEASAKALSENERFKDSLSVFYISFTAEKDGDEIQRFINHCVGKELAQTTPGEER